GDRKLLADLARNGNITDTVQLIRSTRIILSFNTYQRQKLLSAVCLGMIFPENRLAPCANAAFRVRIMPSGLAPTMFRKRSLLRYGTVHPNSASTMIQVGYSRLGWLNPESMTAGYWAWCKRLRSNICLRLLIPGSRGACHRARIRATRWRAPE